jgi:septum formation protein
MFHFGLPGVIFCSLRQQTIYSLQSRTSGCRTSESELFSMMTWQQPVRQVLLASGSPRRKELLDRMGISFEVIHGAAIDESAFLDMADLDGSLQRLALAKGAQPAGQTPEALVLSADTIVVCDNRVLGKPAGRTDARDMLRMLSGRSHRVLSSVALVCRENGFCRAITETTVVFFRKLTDGEIDWYLDTNEAFDKAGAYGIQGSAMIFVDKIDGCFYNVVGLPVSGTIGLFKAFDDRKDHRNVANN